MAKGEALSTLIKAARRSSELPPEESESAATLIKQLGYLALALVNAGVYCYQLSSFGGEDQIFTFRMYLDRFNSNRAALMEQAGQSPIDGYTLGVYATFRLSYKQLPPLDRDFFRLISNFHHSDIPTAMLSYAADKGFRDPWILLPRPEGHEKSVSRLVALLGTNASEVKVRMEEAIRSLCSFSLVSTTVVSDSLFMQMHPVAQAWARNTDAEDFGIMAMQVLTSCCNERFTSVYRFLLSHINEKLEENQGPSLHMNDQSAFALVLREMGHYGSAEMLYGKVLESLQELSAERKNKALVLDTIVIAASLAVTYHYHGRFNEAEKLEFNVLEKRRMILGAEHPDTIIAAANLAATYHCQGRFNEAEKLELDVLEKRRKILGAEHPDTIRAAANLVATYHHQGRFGEAEKLELDVLEKRRKILGAEHPDTLRAAANLAATYGHQGRFDEAEKLELDVLEKSRKILGAEHPDTTRAAANLAATYHHQGRFGEAEKL